MEELSLENPFDPKIAETAFVEESPEMLYDKMLARGEELLKKPLQGGGESRVRVQHSKGRMTVWAHQSFNFLGSTHYFSKLGL